MAELKVGDLTVCQATRVTSAVALVDRQGNAGRHPRPRSSHAGEPRAPISATARPSSTSRRSAHENAIFDRQDEALPALHAGAGLVLPNAWDAGSARILEPVGFSAIATTTAGIAWSCGLADAEALDPDRMRERVGQIVAAVKLGFLDGASAYGDIQRRFGS